MPYDYIIVGGGSAGCVLASRLSENPDTTVLLIEAGGKGHDFRIDVPAAFVQLMKSRHDWAFHSLPQTYALDRKLYLPRGKVLGGSGSINAMIYIRGHRLDYDRWADSGCIGWDYNSVLPYFIKSEHNEHIKDAYHGQNGPWNICNPGYVNPLTRVYLEAMKEHGYNILTDMNGAYDEGAGIHQVNHLNSARHSPARAFLFPVLHRKNLTVSKHNVVRKIVIKDNKVLGVETSKSTYYATKEVIICAGSFQTPQLLMLSGVGDFDELKEHGIKPVVELKGVGKNLQDHAFLPEMLNIQHIKTMDTAETIGNLLRYFYDRKSPFASNIAEGGGFVRTREGLNRPDIQFHFIPAYFSDHGFHRPKGSGASLCSILLHPKSRGSVRLKDSDYRSEPLIDPGIYSHPEDIETMKLGFRIARKILSSTAFEPYRTGWYHGESYQQTEEALDNHIRKYSELLYHPVGTCKMGTDDMSVCNPELRVHGIDNLRIADASVMPEICGGNTHAPVIMIAEKASDLIRSAER